MPPLAANIAYRIGPFTSLCMVLLAIFFDAIQALAVFLNIIPGLGVLVSLSIGFFASLIFWLWFTLNRLDYFSGRRGVIKALTALSTVVIELLPFIDALPMTTLTVVFLIHESIKEDQEEAQEKAAAMAAIVAKQRNAYRQATARQDQEFAAANAAQQEAA